MHLLNALVLLAVSTFVKAAASELYYDYGQVRKAPYLVQQQQELAPPAPGLLPTPAPAPAPPHKKVLSNAEQQEAVAKLWENITVVSAAVTTVVEPTPVPTSELVHPPNMPTFVSNYTLPKDFMWGVAAAAYQIEGAADVRSRSPSIWDVWSHQLANFTEGYQNGDVACNHYYMYKEDIQRMKAMGVPYYSLSISWPRILPLGKGLISREGLQFYADLIDYMKQEGVEPVVTLYHWDLPVILQQRFGGWTSPEIVGEFEKYAQVIFDFLTPQVKYFYTFNEPETSCEDVAGASEFKEAHELGHFDGTMDRHTVKYLCGHYTMLAHAAAAKYFNTQIKPKYPESRLSLKNSWGMAFPKNETSVQDREAARRHLVFHSNWLSDVVLTGDYPPVLRETLGDMIPNFTEDQKKDLINSTDFYAWDGYTGDYIEPAPGGIAACAANSSHPNWPTCIVSGKVSSDGWMIGAKSSSEWLRATPDMFDLGVRYIWDRYKPTGIVIAEIGFSEVSDNDPKLTIAEGKYDEARSTYYNTYLHKILKLVNEDKINVFGCFGWSFMDNYEWHQGYRLRFGMQFVDFSTMKRYYKKSFFVFSDFFKHYVQK